MNTVVVTAPIDPRRLPALRKRLGLGQPELARRMGTNVPDLSRLECSLRPGGMLDNYIDELTAAAETPQA